MSEFDKQETEFSQLLHESPFDDVPRSQHRDLLREQLFQKFDQVIATKTAVRSWKKTFTSWRQLMRRPLPRFIAATVLCLSMAAPWLFLPGHQSTAFAFNNIATVLVEAKTAKFQMEVTTEGQPNQKGQSYYLAPGKYRMEMSVWGVGSVSITDDTTLKILTLMPATKTAILTTSKGKPKDQPSNDPFARLRSLLSKSKDAKDNPFKPMGEKEIDGKKAIGFRSDTALGQFTIWGDPTTGHPVRVESILSGPRPVEVVMSDFEIDVALDETMFEMTPPADYKVQSTEVDVSPAAEQDLIDAFKTCGDISGGELPDSISVLEPMTFFFKHTKERFKNAKNKKDIDFEELKKNTKELAPIQRGFSFAWELPESADAQYAGKGVKQGAADKPIFWYKPKGSMKYRIIFADLTVKEADKAPQDSGAQRLVKPSPSAKPEEK